MFGEDMEIDSRGFKSHDDEEEVTGGVAPPIAAVTRFGGKTRVQTTKEPLVRLGPVLYM